VPRQPWAWSHPPLLDDPTGEAAADRRADGVHDEVDEGVHPADVEKEELDDFPKNAEAEAPHGGLDDEPGRPGRREGAAAPGELAHRRHAGEAGEEMHRLVVPDELVKQSPGSAEGVDERGDHDHQADQARHAILHQHEDERDGQEDAEIDGAGPLLEP